jgi:hypothetical protein
VICSVSASSVGADVVTMAGAYETADYPH